MSQSRVDSRRKDAESQRRKVSSARDSLDTARRELLKDQESARSARSESQKRSREQAASRSADRVRNKEKDLSKEEIELGRRESRLSEAQTEHEKERDREYQQAVKKLDDARRSYERQRVGISREPGPLVATRFPGPFDATRNISITTSAQKDARKQLDVFLSHASEDKEEIADDLAAELERRGVSVWYDKAVLRIGDSLREKIDEGLSLSTFGIVILSQNFFAKKWPKRELEGLTAREDSTGRKVVLPVWHHISRDEVLAHSPTLAGIIAGNTGVQTVEEIALGIAAVVAEPNV